MKDEGSKQVSLSGFIPLPASFILSASHAASSEILPKPAGAESRMSRA
jgi:hypothetical protein